MNYNVPLKEKDSYITDIEEMHVPSMQDERVLIYTGSTKNLQQLARINLVLRNFLFELLKLDLILNYHSKGFSYFVKREKAVLPKGMHLKRYKGVVYEQDPNAFRNGGEQSPKHLLVFFSNLRNVDWKTTNAVNRALVQGFRNKNYVKNTILIRIADYNLINGSSYRNTENYPNFENDIQDLIAQIAMENGILHDDIILAGTSKGGTGALYHGALGDYKVVVNDPVINWDDYNIRRNDVVGMKNFVENDFSNSINQLLDRSNKSKKVIIHNRFSKDTFLYDAQIKIRGVDFYELDDTTMTNHLKTTTGSTGEFWMFVNLALTGIACG